jgi:hypothetical protein
MQQPGVPLAQPVQTGQQPQTVIVQQPNQPGAVVVGAQGQVVIRR